MTVQSPYIVPGLNPDAVTQNINTNQNSDTAPVILAAGRQGDQLVSKVHGEQYASASRGNYFVAAPLAPAGTGLVILAPGGTTSGLVIGNPVGSGVYLELKRLRVVPAGTASTVVISALGLEYGANPVSTTYQTAVTSMPVGSGNTPKAKIWNAVTIVANTYLMTLPLFFSATTNATNTIYPSILFDGTVVVPPGISINLVSKTTQGAITFLVDWEWAEWPI